MTRKPDGPLRKGWTTGACATAATRAAWQALLSGEFPDPVTITLPRGETPSFSLIKAETGEGWARASVIKDAGDDPDVTHGAEIIATIRHGQQGSGITFRAGDGVGMITKPGLPIPVGEAAINPKPREMMTQQIVELANRFNATADVEIEISIPGGQEIALKTWNPRLGIVGGLSVLGTTGVVIPFSCSAWIHSIHRGIDVARATGRKHVAGATGKTSEAAIRQFYSLPDQAALPNWSNWRRVIWTCIAADPKSISTNLLKPLPHLAVMPDSYRKLPAPILPSRFWNFAHPETLT